jgi:hypothetical protein
MGWHGPRECLDWLLIMGRGHLEQALRVYVQHDNQHRPHRALGLQAPDSPAELIAVGQDRPGSVRWRDLLGGLVHEYRRAAWTHLRTPHPPARSFARCILGDTVASGRSASPEGNKVEYLPPRGLREVLKAINSEWRRWRSGALVEDRDGVIARCNSARLAGRERPGMGQLGRLWWQVVAVRPRVPANVVAVWSQSGDPTPSSGPQTGR